jgi:hypothetical protein
MRPTRNQRKDLGIWESNSRPRPADFPLGSAESRAAARAIVSHRPITIVDSGTLPIAFECLPSYQELLRDWKNEGDRYSHELLRDNTLCRCAILKDSNEFRRIRAASSETR